MMTDEMLEKMAKNIIELTARYYKVVRRDLLAAQFLAARRTNPAFSNIRRATLIDFSIRDADALIEALDEEDETR